MVKPLLTDRPIKMTVSIPESVHHKVHLLLLDPVRARTKYGKMSGLVARLLKEWLDEQSKEYQDGIGGTTSGPENESVERGGSPSGRVLHSSIRPSSGSPDSSAEREENEETFDLA